MKRLDITILLLSVGFLINSCSESVSGYDENQKAAYRLAAYNSLSTDDKSTIISDWHNAPVNYAVYASNEHGGPGIILEGSSHPVSYLTPLSRTFPEGTPLVMVTFNTSNDALLGPIVIILLEDATPIGFIERM